MNSGDVVNLNTSEIRPDSYLGYNVTFCIEEKCENCVAYAKPTSADVVIVAAPPSCWSENYWAFTGDGGAGVGTTGTGGGYTGGTGSGVGGTSGGSTGAGGYICPISEWWCESGDYRIIDEQLLTPDYYPFKEDGFPWLWWENPNLKDASGYLYKNLSILAIESYKNPYVLLKCDELNIMPLDPHNGYGKQFQRISQFTSPSEVIDRLVSLNAQNPRSKFNIQSVEKANGASVNCDYFPVRISRLPNGYTMKTLLEKFRKSTNSFIDLSLNVAFSPYVSSGINDTQLFNQDGKNSLSSLVHIKLINDGTVVLSDYTEKVNGNSFIYSTLTSPLDNTHPVSGNREFGIFQNPNAPGEYTFYTSAVDRTTDIITSILNNATNIGFSAADNLWRNVQKNMVNFINNNGGQAALFSPGEITARPDWDKVKKFLKGEISYDQLRIDLGCQ